MRRSGGLTPEGKEESSATVGVRDKLKKKLKRHTKRLKSRSNKRKENKNKKRK